MAIDTEVTETYRLKWTDPIKKTWWK